MAQDIDIEYEISEQYERNGYERAKQIYQNFLADKSYNITEEKSARICLLLAKLALVNKDMETVRNLLNFDGGNDKSKKKK